MPEPGNAELLPGTLVVFVGHSDDASQEADAIVGLQAELQTSIDARLEVMPNGGRFSKVKVWNWRYDGKAEVGGQEKVVTPYLNEAHVAVFVFKSRVGPVTWQELKETRDRAEPCPIIALFPKTPPDQAQMHDLEVMHGWVDLLEKRRELTADWIQAGSKSITPVELYSDADHARTIVRGHFEKLISRLLKSESAAVPAPPAKTLDIQSETELRIAYETTAKSRHPCNGADPSHLDWSLVERFRRREIPQFSGGPGAQLLTELGLFSPLSPSPMLHNAAVLCFCERPHLFFPNATATFIVGEPGSDEVVTEDVEGPLSSQVEQLFDKTTSRLARVWRFDRGGLRTETTEIPTNVVREAISNAVAHRDYYIPGTIQVRLRQTHLEIQNPGRFPPDASWEVFLKEGMVSQPADAAVALYLKRLLAVEAVGRGFTVFRQHVAEYGEDSIVWEMPTPSTVLMRIRRHVVRNRKPEFQVFLAWARKDRAAAIELADLLARQGLSIWRAESGSGPSSRDVLTQGMAVSETVVLLIGEEGLRPWHEDEAQAALIEAVRNQQPVVPVLIGGARRTDVPPFLDGMTVVDLRRGLAEGMPALVRGITGKEPERVEHAEAAAEPEAFEYDVFISYMQAEEDRKWVVGELLPRIEQAGLRAIIDFRDFPPGSPRFRAIEQAVMTSRKTLVVLSPTYVSFSRDLDVLLEPTNRRRLIPLMRMRCELPQEIATLTYIDFTEGADHDLAWRQLLTALGTLEVHETPTRENWLLAHPYASPPHFAGRAAERATLSAWLSEEAEHPLMVLRALGGFGKTALVWHWLMHDVDPVRWPRVIWWSFYEADAGFEAFLSAAVRYLDPETTSASPRKLPESLLHNLRSEGTLLVLDGFERALRAFSSLDGEHERGGDERDCISPLAESFLRRLASATALQGRVLLTSRLRPAAVESRDGTLLRGCREETLLQLQPADAVELFHALGIRGNRAEIESAAEAYGFHPLSLRLLAGLIVSDLQQPGDIAAAARLDVTGDLVQRRHHILEQAFEALASRQRSLLCHTACFRGAVGYDVLRALEASPDLDADLRELIARGLLLREGTANRFDLHPIVRRYAYDRLAEPARARIHLRLRDYYGAIPKPGHVESLDDISPVVELYHHTVRAGHYDEAAVIFSRDLAEPIRMLGAYRLGIDLLQALVDAEPRRSILHQLAQYHVVVGEPARALSLFDQTVAGDPSQLAEAAGTVKIAVGAFRSAEEDLRRSKEAVGHYYLALLLAYRGAYGDAEQELSNALACSGDLEDDVLAGRIIMGLLRSRTARSTLTRRYLVQCARRLLKRAGTVQLDQARAHWLLGAALRVDGRDARNHLDHALLSARRGSMVELEADVLIELARASAGRGDVDDARRLAEEALVITERSGYVLRGADAHLVLARLGGADQREHAFEALRLAACDGPPYVYKVAHDEASALLEE